MCLWYFVVLVHSCQFGGASSEACLTYWKKKGRVSKKARSISVCFKARGWRCQRPGPEFGQLQRPGLAGTRKGGKRMYLKHIVSTLFQPQNLVEEWCVKSCKSSSLQFRSKELARAKVSHCEKSLLQPWPVPKSHFDRSPDSCSLI